MRTKYPFRVLAPLGRFTSTLDEIRFGQNLSIQKLPEDELRHIKKEYLQEGGVLSLQQQGLSRAKYAISLDCEIFGEVIDDSLARDQVSRLLTALRLLDQGEISTPLILTRSLGNHPSMPSGEEIARPADMTNTWGDVYKIKHPRDRLAVDFWRIFEPLSYTDSSSSAANKMILALRRFNMAYERLDMDDLLLDTVIGFDTLFGTGTESSYRVSSRVSRLLARSDQERVSYFEIVKAGYDMRNRLVHHGRSVSGVSEILGETWSAGLLTFVLKRFLATSIKATMLVLAEGEKKPRSKEEDRVQNLNDLIDKAGLSSDAMRNLSVLLLSNGKYIWSDSATFDMIRSRWS